MTHPMLGSLTTMHALMGAHTLTDDERAGVPGGNG